MSRERLEQLKDKIRPFLVEYLQQQGIDPHHKFSCLNPVHQDKSPSAGLLEDKTAIWCFGCSRSWDIFDCAAFLEDKPLVGKEFVQENVLYLADKFGISHEMEELTPEELYELDTYRAYKVAAEIVSTSQPSKQVKTEIQRRGWSQTNLRRSYTGTVVSFSDFRDQLKAAGFSAKFLDEVDLGKRGVGTGLPSPIFQPHNLIFTTCDEFGRPVGFAARNLNHKPGDDRKYVNTATTDVKVNIYRKGQRLYGLDVAKKDPKIYLFEGYTDVLTAREKGLDNCVALSGTALTREHVALLKRCGATELVLALDGDNPGQRRTLEILDTRLAGHKDLTIKVKIIPNEQDPDEFIREKGIEAFRAIPELSAFQWRLTQFSEDEEPEVICNRMLQLIVTEASHITQETMCRDLAKRTGYDLRAIRMELFRLVDEKNLVRERERSAIVDGIKRDLELFSGNSEAILTEGLVKLTEVNIKHDEASLSETGFVALLKQQQEIEESRKGQHMGFFFGPKFHDLQVALAGELQGMLLVCGGRPNSGKSSLLSCIGHDIATHYEQNNTVVVYHTIDDTPEQILPKFVTIQDGSHSLELNHVMFPNHWERILGGGVLERRRKAYAGLQKLVEGGWLVLKGAHPSNLAGGGANLTFTRTMLAFLKQKYPERHILYILDNFHKLLDFQEVPNEPVRLKRQSNALKGLAGEFGITVWATMEYTKMEPGTRPNMNNLAGSVGMQYDANWVSHVYNQVHDLGAQGANLFHIEAQTDGSQLKLPRIELIVDKNKVATYKSSIFLDFWPASSDFSRVSAEEVARVQTLADSQESVEREIGNVYSK